MFREDSDRKEFVKLFNGICNWNQPWERWSDMVQMFGITISNTVDKRHYEEREERYLSIIRKYAPEEQKRFPELFAYLVMAFDRNPFQDFLGSIYMALNLSDHWKGQFFTPYSVCQMMAAMSQMDASPEFDKPGGYITVNDPACGAGALFIAGAENLHLKGINYQQKALFVGQDLDTVTGLMCYIQLSLLGCAGYVRIGDSLADPDTADPLFGGSGSEYWKTPMFYHNVWAVRRLVKGTRLLDERKEEVPC